MANRVLIEELKKTCELYQMKLEAIEFFLQSAKDAIEKTGKDLINMDIDDAEVYTLKLKAVNEIVAPLKEKRESLIKALSNATQLGAFVSANGDSSKEEILSALINMAKVECDCPECSGENEASNKE